MKRIACASFAVVLCCCAYSQSTPAPNEASINLEEIRSEILESDKPSSSSNSVDSNSASTPKQQAEEILSNPLYRENIQTEGEESWLSRAMQEFSDWLNNLLNRQREPRQNGSPFLAAAGALSQIVIFILVAALIGFLIFMIAKIRINRKGKIDDTDSDLVSAEEAKRSADQWITEADRLSRNGEFRAAIRCLYLACLMRLDENRILRFERHETNWEHLHRFRDIAVKPGNFNLDPVTQKFDQAWYGLIPQNLDDVEWFKSEYQKLLQGIREVKQ